MLLFSRRTAVCFNRVIQRTIIRSFHVRTIRDEMSVSHSRLDLNHSCHWQALQTSNHVDRHETLAKPILSVCIPSRRAIYWIFASFNMNDSNYDKACLSREPQIHEQHSTP